MKIDLKGLIENRVSIWKNFKLHICDETGYVSQDEEFVPRIIDGVMQDAYELGYKTGKLSDTKFSMINKDEDWYSVDENMHPRVNCCIDCYKIHKTDRKAKFIYCGYSLCEKHLIEHMNIK